MTRQRDQLILARITGYLRAVRLPWFAIPVHRERRVRDESVRWRVGGFTLVELLTAVAVTAVIAALAFSVATGVLKSMDRRSGATDASSRARLIFDLIEADLQSAIFTEDGRAWFAATLLDRSDNSGLWMTALRQKPTGADGSLNLDSDSISAHRFGLAGVWLRFFTGVRGTNELPSPEVPDPGISAPTAVAYQMVRRADPAFGVSVGPRYLLHRTVVRPAQTLGRSGALECGFDFAASGNGYVTPAPENDGSQSGDPYSVKSPTAASTVIGSGVIDFGLKLYGTDAAGTFSLIFPVSAADTDHLATSWSTSATREVRYPETIEIIVRILTPEGESLIAAFEAAELGPRPAGFARDSDWWWDIAQAHSEQFSRRFSVVAGSR